jgi:preprotein translocase subunit SecY
MVGGLGNVGKIPELRKRILFTIAMLAVYRLGVFVSTPGIDVVALRKQFEQAGDTLFGLINMFSGGSLENFSIFTLGIMPYISVSIIVQFLTPVIPALDSLKKEGAAGQRILTRYTRQGTILLALIQGALIAKGLETSNLVLPSAGRIEFYLGTMITLTAGTAFIMWLGEQITERGIGNGMSIIIFAGIIARMPQAMLSTILLSKEGQISWLTMLAILAFFVFTVYCIVYVERSFRNIPIQYPRRTVGKGIIAPPQHLPLKLNMAGVIPPIFASALLVLPATIAQFFPENEVLQVVMDYLSPGTNTYTAVFVTLIIGFAYYYTSVVYNPDEVADNLKKSGAFIPTVRPGKQTSDFLYAVLNRLTFWGGLYIAAVCVVPQMVYLSLGVSTFAYVFGGTAILIVVGVTLDTASQIESHVVAKNYEAFMTKTTKLQRGQGSMRVMRSRVLKR